MRHRPSKPWPLTTHLQPVVDSVITRLFTLGSGLSYLAETLVPLRRSHPYLQSIWEFLAIHLGVSGQTMTLHWKLPRNLAQHE